MKMHPWNQPNDLLIWFQSCNEFLSRTCLWRPCHVKDQLFFPLLGRTLRNNSLSEPETTQPLMDLLQRTDWQWSFDHGEDSVFPPEWLTPPNHPHFVSLALYGATQVSAWKSFLMSRIPQTVIMAGVADSTDWSGRQIVAALAHHQHRQLLTMRSSP